MSAVRIAAARSDLQAHAGQLELVRLERDDLSQSRSRLRITSSNGGRLARRRRSPGVDVAEPRCRGTASASAIVAARRARPRERARRRTTAGCRPALARAVEDRAARGVHAVQPDAVVLGERRDLLALDRPAGPRAAPRAGKRARARATASDTPSRRRKRGGRLAPAQRDRPLVIQSAPSDALLPAEDARRRPA